MLLRLPLSQRVVERLVVMGTRVGLESLVTSDRKLIAGIEKHLGKAELVILGNEKFRMADLVKLLEARLGRRDATASAKAAWLEASRLRKEEEATTDPTVEALKLHLLAKYGASVTVLADFGLAPRTRRKSSAAVKARATEKAAATRASKQKGAVVVTTPATPVASVTNGAAAGPQGAHVPLVGS
jgi:hypothetical protein